MICTLRYSSINYHTALYFVKHVWKLNWHNCLAIVPVNHDKKHNALNLGFEAQN